MKKVSIFYITDRGFEVSKKVSLLYPNSQINKFQIEKVRNAWSESDLMVFVLATGIVVRTISRFITDKRKDPGVVVIDDSARYVISLLSGHLGGANNRAREIAEFIGAEAVITTSSDVNDLPSLDIWAKENDLFIEDYERLPSVMTKFINRGFLNVYTDIEGLSLCKEFVKVSEPLSADILITNKFYHGENHFYLRPKNLVIGVGLNSGTKCQEIEDAVRSVLASNNLSFHSIKFITTIETKKNEIGLKEFVSKYGFKLITFTPEQLNSINGYEKSPEVFRVTGAYGVAEPSAILGSKSGRLIVSKQKFLNVTLAVAEAPFEKRGVLYIVGTGPGSVEDITYRAMKALRDSEVVIGYDKYVDLIRDIIKDKEIFSTGMTEEITRCKKAVELAMKGKRVSLISGGDPGIYAMAGLVFEILRTQSTECRVQTEKEKNLTSDSCLLSSGIDIEVIPGISALNACAARLGAPLMHDFAVISLSDRLTPWSIIEERIKSAAKSDFVIILFNPRSMGRQEHISIARDIMLGYRSPYTPVGIVRGATRGDEEVIITDLKNMLNHHIDMQTTVIIGNSRTFTLKDWMVTPRGYENKLKHNNRPKKSKVAFLWDESFLWGLMAYKALIGGGLKFDLITSDDIRDGLLKGYSMLFVPGGWASNKLKRLGDKGVEAIKNFVYGGGSYFGICGGAGLATLDGIGLLNIRRKPTKERVPSFSGRIYLNISEHPIFTTSPVHPSSSTPIFYAWWPSQFSPQDNDIDILARFGSPLEDSFSSDINYRDAILRGGWQTFEEAYGINLDPEKLKDDPAVVEGRYGDGKVLLSLIHFDTIHDSSGLNVLRNIWMYLGGDVFMKEERPRVFSPPMDFISDESLLELLNPVSELIDFGIRNFLWFWRNEMILGWRRGVRGLEYCTLYVLLKEIVYLLKNFITLDKEIKEEISVLSDIIPPFVEKAKRLLILEKDEIEKRSINFGETGNKEIDSLRSELFSLSKSHGGKFKEIIDRLDTLLFRLMRLEHPSS